MIKAQPGLPTKALGQAGEAGDKLLSHSGWAKNTTKCNEDKHRGLIFSRGYVEVKLSTFQHVFQLLCHEYEPVRFPARSLMVDKFPFMSRIKLRMDPPTFPASLHQLHMEIT